MTSLIQLRSSSAMRDGSLDRQADDLSQQILQPLLAELLLVDVQRFDHAVGERDQHVARAEVDRRLLVAHVRNNPITAPPVVNSSISGPVSSAPALGGKPQKIRRIVAGVDVAQRRLRSSSCA